MKSILYLDNGKYLHFCCPLGLVSDSSDCYHGSGIGRCPYFVRFAHQESPDIKSWVVCKAPLVQPVKSVQLSINFDVL